MNDCAIEFLGSRTRANPVFTRNPEDLRRLRTTFFGYVLEAEAYMASSAPRAGEEAKSRWGIPTVSPGDADARADDLLRLWTDRVRTHLGRPKVPVP